MCDGSSVATTGARGPGRAAIQRSQCRQCGSGVVLNCAPNPPDSTRPAPAQDRQTASATAQRSRAITLSSPAASFGAPATTTSGCPAPGSGGRGSPPGTRSATWARNTGLDAATARAASAAGSPSMVTDPDITAADPVSSPPARAGLDAVDEQLIARLAGRAREGGLQLAGEGGLLAQLTWSTVPERSSLVPSSARPPRSRVRTLSVDRPRQPVLHDRSRGQSRVGASLSIDGGWRARRGRPTRRKGGSSGVAASTRE